MIMKRTKENSNLVNISVSMTKSMLEELEKYAESLSVNRSGAVCFALKHVIDESKAINNAVELKEQLETLIRLAQEGLSLPKFDDGENIT